MCKRPHIDALAIYTYLGTGKHGFPPFLTCRSQCSIKQRLAKRHIPLNNVLNVFLPISKGTYFMSKLLQYRPHAVNSVLAWINTKRCWHLDAWLYEQAGVLYLRAETREAGELILGQAWFALARDQFGLFQLTPCNSPLGARTVLLNAPTVRRAIGDFQLGDVFWRLIWPLTNLWPRGTYKRRSVAFHMVKPVGVDDPCEGITNLYDTTGRAARDAIMAARVHAARQQRDG